MGKNNRMRGIVALIKELVEAEHCPTEATIQAQDTLRYGYGLPYSKMERLFEEHGGDDFETLMSELDAMDAASDERDG